MVLILAVGGVMGWQARRASLQRRAVAAIGRLDGSSSYDWQMFEGDGHGHWPAMTPAGPEWLRAIVGDEYFQEVEGVSLPGDEEFGGPGRTEAELAEIKRLLAEDQLACLDGLDRLRVLAIDGIPLGPEGFRRLARLDRLEVLSIVGQTLRLEDLAEVAKLTRLKKLSIQIERGEDVDLAFLDRLPELRELELFDTPVTDAALTYVGRLDRLERLDLDGRGVTDAGLQRLSGLTSLRFLTIRRGNRLTDAGLARLEGKADLWFLDLSGTPVNGITFERLRKLPSLGVLVIEDGGIDPKAIADLKASRPNMSLTVRPPRPIDPTPSNPGAK